MAIQRNKACLYTGGLKPLVRASAFCLQDWSDPQLQKRGSCAFICGLTIAIIRSFQIMHDSQRSVNLLQRCFKILSGVNGAVFVLAVREIVTYHLGLAQGSFENLASYALTCVCACIFVEKIYLKNTYEVEKYYDTMTALLLGCSICGSLLEGGRLTQLIKT